MLWSIVDLRLYIDALIGKKNQASLVDLRVQRVNILKYFWNTHFSVAKRGELYN